MKFPSTRPVLVKSKSNSVEEIVTSSSTSPLEFTYVFVLLGVPVCGGSRSVVKSFSLRPSGNSKSNSVEEIVTSSSTSPLRFTYDLEEATIVPEGL